MSVAEKFTFEKARPIWEAGLENEKNITLSAVATVNAKNAVVKLAAASSYIITVNGKFVLHGPTRCCHGYYNVDVHDISKHLTEETNYIAIRAVGYNINSFQYIDVPAFLCAEIVSDGEIIAATGEENNGFKYYHCDERVSVVQKYSFQRTFVETYKLEKNAFGYEFSQTDKAEAIIENTEEKDFIMSDVPYPDGDILKPTMLSRGDVEYNNNRNFGDRCIYEISDVLKGFKVDEIENLSAKDTAKFSYVNEVPANEDTDSIAVKSDKYVTLDFGRDYTGIFSFKFSTTGGILYFVYDEILDDNNKVNEFRLQCSNTIKIEADAGEYIINCAEPYTLKYLTVVSKGADVVINDLCLNKNAFPNSQIIKKCASNNPAIKHIYDAALETFAANTVDIYMDCPSRERAGWLCDSFFTSRVERLMTGKARVEKSFLRNFLLPERFESLPEGMLPMCYPSDHLEGVYIPNWAMWYICELEEYLKFTGDRELIDFAKPRLYALLNFLKKYENEYGLLENLEKWVFIEWSKANDLTQDVNFPSNMEYARIKEIIGNLYGDDALIQEGKKLKDVIREMSLDKNGFFCDNAVRRDGKLELSHECTEACQYYAFFFEIATPETNKWLWNTLINDFGYSRREHNKYPEIYFANAFIGNYLRLEIIERWGDKDTLLDNILGYFTYMADQTGTLWENDTSYASCNHGFASHVLYWFDKLGLLEDK